MKIVILADCLSTQNTGIHYFALQWLQRVLQKYPHHEYTLVASDTISEVDVRQIIVPIKANFPFHLRWRQLFSLPERVQAMNPDWVIELAHFGPFGLPKHVKRATLIHDLTPITHPQFHDKMSVISHYLFFNRIVSSADCLLTNSIATKKEIIKKYSKKENQIIVNYPRSFLQAKPDGIKKNYILNIGTIEPRKDQLTLLKAFSKLAIEDPDIRLEIIGKNGWKNRSFWKYLDRMKAEIRNRVEVHSYLPRHELEVKLASAKIFVFPSIVEGFGLPILEAMQYGIPLLLSDTIIHREVAENAADYFPVSDVNNLKSRLSILLQSPKNLSKLSDKALNRFEYFAALDLEIPFLEKE